jgi:hypothetical protein
MSFERQPRTLHRVHLKELERAIARDQPSLVPRIQGMQLDDIKQPFFDARILEATFAVPTPSHRLYVAWPYAPERFLVLTGHIEHLNEVAAGDPPDGLDEPKYAAEYMRSADAWTTASTVRELSIASLEDIPWWEHLGDDQRAQIDDVKNNLGPAIAEQGLVMALPRYKLRRWVLVGQALVERVLMVSTTGQFVRQETVHRRGLPVPSGRIWGHKNGRFVPVG